MTKKKKDSSTISQASSARVFNSHRVDSKSMILAQIEGMASRLIEQAPGCSFKIVYSGEKILFIKESQSFVSMRITELLRTLRLVVSPNRGMNQD
jgi:hypothetical protein